MKTKYCLEVIHKDGSGSTIYPSSRKEQELLELVLSKIGLKVRVYVFVYKVVNGQKTFKV